MDMMHSMAFAVAPEAPSNLAGVLSSDGTSASLSWNDNSLGETGFTIQRASDPAFTLQLTQITRGANVTAYTDNGLTPGATYYYRVFANNLVGDNITLGFPTTSVDSLSSNAIAFGVSILVTVPNGAEIWAAGSTHNVTWTQTGLTGNVTIDLYKAGVYQKTLGTAAASAGTFSWAIAAGEPAAIDYRIRVWQGIVSDQSDVDFTIVLIVMHADFNGDGQEDILWRYYSTGGSNRIWFLGSAIMTPAPLPMAKQQVQIDSLGNLLARNKSPRKIFRNPRELGILSSGKPVSSKMESQNAMGARNSQVAAINDPRMAGRPNIKRDSLRSPSGFADPRQVKAALGTQARPDSKAKLAAAQGLIGGADIPAVSDLNWEIKGTGDFNKDGSVDILWRYNGPGGYNVVWYMSGTNLISGIDLLPVNDLNWQIAGTGDFNNDGNIDILWRYNGPGGYIRVWFMNGVNIIGGADVLPVDDLNWQIVGTGDFNNDGNIDILWRYNGPGGYNYIWYMIGPDWAGGGDLLPVTDLNWQIVGTGDYNTDGSIDLLWRYYGSGGFDYIWYLNGTTWIDGADLVAVPDLNWKIVGR
jgi:hypothetical protein